MKITEAMKEALWDMYDAGMTKSERGKPLCRFCGGENTCKCGQCWEGDYHDNNCPVYMAYSMAMADPDDEFVLNWSLDW